MATLEHENDFLACILISPSIITKTKLTESYFLNSEPRKLFRAMQKCSDSRITIDYISVNEAEPELDKTYAARIRDSIPSSANWKFYEGKIIEAFQRYRIERLGKYLGGIDDGADPTEYIERAERELLELASGITSAQITHVGAVIPEWLAMVEERYKNKGRLPGLSCGISNLDTLLGGFQPGRYYVIGARPSEGKSALAVNMACHMAIRGKATVGIISAESGNIEIVTRMFSSEGRINGQTILAGTMKDHDYTSVMTAGERIKESPIYLYDAPNVQYQEMKSVCRQMVAVYKVKAIFVDYLQILQWHDTRIARHEQVAAISLATKELARELHIPIIALSQLKRDAEGREPEMADLDYSKQIEQDADALVLIYHPKAKEGEEAKPSMLLVKKNRDGPKGAVYVTFAREYVKFYENERSR